MANAIISQGAFTSNGNAKILKLRSDVDWMEVINITNVQGAANGAGCKYYWQRGMEAQGVTEYHPAADHTLAIDYIDNLFSLIDTSNLALGAAIAVTGGTNATRPVYATGNTTGLTNGAIVRVYGTNHDTLNGLDFSIDTVTANTSFRLANTLATAPGAAAGANGHYRLVAPNVEAYSMFTPSNRNIANISQASSAVVTTLVDHNYSVGQAVTFRVDVDSGMTQIDGLVGNITAVTAGTFTVDIDTTAFTAFQFPLPAAAPCTPAQVVLVGDTHNISDQSAVGKLYNQSFIGMILQPGILAPAGVNADVIKWRAGKSFSINNE